MCLHQRMHCGQRIESKRLEIIDTQLKILKHSVGFDVLADLSHIKNIYGSAFKAHAPNEIPFQLENPNESKYNFHYLRFGWKTPLL